MKNTLTYGIRDRRPMAERVLDWWFGVCDGTRADEKLGLAAVLAVPVLLALTLPLWWARKPVQAGRVEVVARRVYVDVTVPRRPGPKDGF